MSRSSKKGPYVEERLLARVNAMKRVFTMLAAGHERM